LIQSSDEALAKILAHYELVPIFVRVRARNLAPQIGKVSIEHGAESLCFLVVQFELHLFLLDRLSAGAGIAF
jgi:hypothetical protein